MNQQILIVEDDPGMADFTKILLEEEGYKVRIAGTAEEALELISPDYPELLLTDIQLPLVS